MLTIKARTEETKMNLLVNTTSDSVTMSFFLIVVTLSNIAKIRINIVVNNTAKTIVSKIMNPFAPAIARLANGVKSEPSIFVLSVYGIEFSPEIASYISPINPTESIQLSINVAVSRTRLTKALFIALPPLQNSYLSVYFTI